MPSFVAYEGHPFFLLPVTYRTPQLSHLNQNLQRIWTKPYLFYQSAKELFLILSRLKSSYLHIRQDFLIQFLRTLHLFLIFLPFFLKCYAENDNLSIISLMPYFHWKVQYTLLHFSHLIQISELISLYI